MADEILTHPTMAERVRAAILPLVPECDPGVYRGNEPEYSVYQLTRQPALHGDDAPHAQRYLVMVHWFLPAGINPEEKLTQISRALAQLGTYPTVEDASDLTGQHFVFEMQAVDGGL